MSVADVEKLAFELPERDRAVLAANLLQSLPSVLSAADEGVAEAVRRDEELTTGSVHVISLDQLEARIQSQRA